MSNIITGYMTYAVTLSDLGLVLTNVRKVTEAQAKKEFKRLLEDQIETITDEIVLGRTQCPSDQSIYTLARGEVLRRAVCAEQRMENIEFNLSISCQCFAGKDDEGNPCTYIQMFCPNDIYTKLITKKVSMLIPFNMVRGTANSPDPRQVNRKAEKWNEIMENYDGEPVLGTKLFAYEKMVPEPGELKFRKPAERAADLAQEHTLDCLLGMYATGQQVQPNKLMEYMMLALNRLHNPGIQDYEKQKRAELIRLLPEIDLEMITTPGAVAMKRSGNTAAGPDVNTKPAAYQEEVSETDEKISEETSGETGEEANAGDEAEDKKAE